jgi:hypothetical protein
MATTLRGINSRCCFIEKCHDLIRIKSSNVNSILKCPSIQTYEQKKSLNHFSIFLDITLINDGLPKQVINEPCSQSMDIVG